MDLGFSAGWVWAAAVLLALGISAPAARLALADSPKPELVVLVDGAPGPSEIHELSIRAATLMVRNQLGRRYGAISVFASENSREFLRAIARHRAGALDVFFLGRSNQCSNALGRAALSGMARRGARHGLRVVLDSACGAPDREESWRALGARTIVTAEPVDSSSALFGGRFARAWARGEGALEAASSAYSDILASARILAPIAAPGELSLEREEASAPRVSGRDLTVSGEIGSTRAIRPIQGKALNIPPALTEHAGIETAGMRLLSLLSPEISIAPDQAESPQVLADRLAPLAWQQLGDVFPPMDEMGQVIWIDADALRYAMASLGKWLGPSGEALLGHLLGARLVRSADGLEVSAYLDEAMDLRLKPAGQARVAQLYGAHLPRTIRAKVSLKDSVITVEGLSGGVDPLELLAKIPAVSDRVLLNRFTLDLSTGRARVEAGLLDDSVTLVANAQLAADPRTIKLDLKETLERNLNWLLWPAFVFSMR